MEGGISKMGDNRLRKKDMKVRAKFFCCGKKAVQYGPGHPLYNIVELSPASGKGNEAWSEAPPSGKIELTITNPQALAAFEVGKFYFVDFIPDEPPGPLNPPAGQPQVG
jgi:hypothetical protein